MSQISRIGFALLVMLTACSSGLRFKRFGPLSKPPSARSIEESFEALSRPLYDGYHINAPGWPTKWYLDYDHYRPCADAIDLLIEAPPEFTRALIRHALDFDIGSKSDLATEHYLLECLNRRLDTRHREIEKMREHLRRAGHE